MDCSGTTAIADPVLRFLHRLFTLSSFSPGYLEIQFSHSVLSDSLQPMNCSMPGLPVHHQLLEFTQTHVCRVSDAIQPSHPLSSPDVPNSLKIFN